MGLCRHRLWNSRVIVQENPRESGIRIVWIDGVLAHSYVDQILVRVHAQLRPSPGALDAHEPAHTRRLRTLSVDYADNRARLGRILRAAGGRALIAAGADVKPPRRGAERQQVRSGDVRKRLENFSTA